jgi:lipoyl synthase
MQPLHNHTPLPPGAAAAALPPQMIFYLPGMFVAGGQQGHYAALSITGRRCALMCDHCQGKILATMMPGEDPDALLNRCVQLNDRGFHGVLLSGGCDTRGALPWERFHATIARIKARTGLHISVHSGLVTVEQARSLKAAGVDQALIDVVGSDDTFRRIYHLDNGTGRIRKAMEALEKADLPMVPHIVCGIDYGRIIGERQAVAMISGFRVALVVVVGLMKLSGVPASQVAPPTAEAIAEIIAETRHRLPETPVSLGCARQRGNTRLEILAIDAGVTRMALPSEEAVAHARQRGLRIAYQRTCCSLPPERLSAGWLGDG